MNDKWIRVNSSEFQHETTSSRSISFYISPYDIPQAVRGFFDSETNEVVIAFRYADGAEPTETRTHSDKVNLVIGKKSNRIFEIRLHKDFCATGTVKLDFKTTEMISDALKRLSPAEGRTHARSNYNVATSVIRAKNEVLLEAACPQT